MDRRVLAVTRGGSFSGSAVETNTSTPGRSERPVGFDGEGCSNLSCKVARSVALFIGFSFGRMSRIQEKANQISHTIDSPHSHIASSLGFVTRHHRKKKSITRRSTISNLKQRSINIAE